MGVGMCKGEGFSVENCLNFFREQKMGRVGEEGEFWRTKKGKKWAYFKEEKICDCDCDCDEEIMRIWVAEAEIAACVRGVCFALLSTQNFANIFHNNYSLPPFPFN